MGLAVGILTDHELSDLMAQLRDRTRKARDASLKWEARRYRLIKYCQANNYTEEQKRYKFSVDWALNDAMDSWNWNRREANRIAQLILAEKALRDMLGDQIVVMTNDPINDVLGAMRRAV